MSLWKYPKNVSFLWFSDFRTCPCLPKPIIFICDPTKSFQIIREQIPNDVRRSIFGKSHRFGNQTVLRILEKTRAEHILNARLINFPNLEHGWISIKNHEMAIWYWIWDQYLQENMKWTCCISTKWTWTFGRHLIFNHRDWTILICIPIFNRWNPSPSTLICWLMVIYPPTSGHSSVSYGHSSVSSHNLLTDNVVSDRRRN